jgi:hypothetical protein
MAVRLEGKTQELKTAGRGCLTSANFGRAILVFNGGLKFILTSLRVEPSI